MTPSDYKTRAPFDSEAWREQAAAARTERRALLREVGILPREEESVIYAHPVLTVGQVRRVYEIDAVAHPVDGDVTLYANQARSTA